MDNLQPHLIGDVIELRPLRPEDWVALFEVASDPKIWEQHPNYDRHKEEIFRRFFDEALDSGGAFAAIDRKTRKIVGSSRYVWYDRAKRALEIGWTFLSRAYSGGAYNGEMKKLMIEHAFTFASSVVFVVGPDNLRSRKAVEKIGAVLTERREKGTTADGQPLDLVVYEIRNSEL